MNPEADPSAPYGTRTLGTDDAPTYRGAVEPTPSAPAALEPPLPPSGTSPPPYGTVAAGGYGSAAPPQGYTPPRYGSASGTGPPPQYGQPPQYGSLPPSYGPPPPGYRPPPPHYQGAPYGAPPGFNPHSPGYQPRPLSEDEERTWGMLAHLSALAGMVIPFGHILGPLVVLLTRGKESEWVARQARHTLNFSITMFIASMVSLVLCLVMVGFILFPLVIVLRLVYTIIGCIAANNGQDYRYPLTIEFVK